MRHAQISPKIIWRQWDCTVSWSQLRALPLLLHRKHYSVQRNTKLYVHDAESDSVKLYQFEDIVNYSKDPRILYNCRIDEHRLKVPHYVEKEFTEKLLEHRKKERVKASVPLIIEKLYGKQNINPEDYRPTKKEYAQEREDHSFQLPFSKVEDHQFKNQILEKKEASDSAFLHEKVSVKEDIAVRLKAFNEKKDSHTFPQVSETSDEEQEVRIYKDTLLSDLSEVDEKSGFQYGTADPQIPKSSVPCGGCGAFLHCQDEGLPGYVPSELFSGKNKAELRSLDCQRCFFLKKFNTALNVRVSPDVYEQALTPITHSKAMVIVVLDVLDVPCSIWPGLFNLIGTRRPVVIVGNKIDLLPLDNPNFLKTFKESFISTIERTDLWRTNIRHVCLVSAKTGYGIEALISNIQIKWGAKDDIYIIGCTNAGKSTLFNALLGSDMCQVAAADLIKRATPSPWPGTTLNLLKFPLLKPSGKRLFDRQRRLEAEKDREKTFTTSLLKKSTGRERASLSGHIGRTIVLPPADEEPLDPFKVNAQVIPRDSNPTMGIDDSKKEYINSKWCYDTPGTVQPDQFLSLLSHEELMDVLPKSQIVPRFFTLKPSQSLFVAGLARLDLLYCRLPVRVAVCCSSKLPITIVPSSEASTVYRSYLGTYLLGVPKGKEERLRRWNPLKPTNIRIRGRDEEIAADVVLSSAGFIGVSAPDGEEVDLRGWTPGGRGVYLRRPSMIPLAFSLKGKRIRDSLRHHNRYKNFLKDV